MRSLLAITGALAAALVSLPASANNGGIAGYTGKPNFGAPQGESCNQCHSGATAPGVTLNGPASLTAGQSAEYTLVVSTGLSRAGAGVAATDGVVLTPGTGMRDSFGEMVQNGPLTVSGGQATFRFTVKAPASGTSLRLWAVGLAANNTGGATGDRAAHAVRDITITGGAPAPTPDAGGGSSGADAGAGSDPAPDPTDADGGTTAGTGTSGSGDPDDELTAEDVGAAPDDDDPQTGTSRRSGLGSSGTDAQACASSPVRAGSDAMLSGAALALALAIARRRRPRA